MPSIKELFELQEGLHGPFVTVKQDKQAEYQQLINGLKDIQKKAMDNGLVKAFKRKQLKACELVIATYPTLDELDDYVENQWPTVAKDFKHFLLAQVAEDNQYHLIAVNFRHRVIREELKVSNSPLGNLAQLILPLLTSINHNLKVSDQPEHKKLFNQVKEHIADWLGHTRLKVFLSYAWASEDYPETFEQDKFYQACVEQMAVDLEKTGLAVFLDKWCDVPGREISSFIERAFEESHYIIPIGTRLYNEKFRRNKNKLPPLAIRTASEQNRKDLDHVLAFEVAIIQELSTKGQQVREKIIPLFLEEVEGKSSFPFLLDKKIPVYGNNDYYKALYGILQAVYRIDPKDFRVTVPSLLQGIATPVDPSRLPSDLASKGKEPIKKIIPIPNSVIQLFTGDNPKGPSCLDFETWYHPDVCHYLLQLVDNNVCCVPVVFLDTGGNNTTTFEAQLEALILLANSLDRPAVFIAKEPGAESHFISGLLKANQLVLINPLGLATHQDCYKTLAKLQNTNILNTIWLSSTTLQHKNYEKALVSCGPISIELMMHILEQWSLDDLNTFWAELKSNEPTCHEKTGLQYIGLPIEKWLPESLKSLLKAATKESYQQQVSQIRQTHYQLLEQKPRQLVAQRNLSIDIYLQQLKNEAPSQVLFNALITKYSSLLNIQALPTYNLLKEGLNKDLEKTSSPLSSYSAPNAQKLESLTVSNLTLSNDFLHLSSSDNWLIKQASHDKAEVVKARDIAKSGNITIFWLSWWPIGRNLDTTFEKIEEWLENAINSKKEQDLIKAYTNSKNEITHSPIHLSFASMGEAAKCIRETAKNIEERLLQARVSASERKNEKRKSSIDAESKIEQPFNIVDPDKESSSLPKKQKMRH